MAHTQRLSLLMGLAAMTAVGSALPAYANVTETQDIAAVLESETVTIAFKTVPEKPAAAAILPLDLAQVEVPTEVTPVAAETAPAAAAIVPAPAGVEPAAEADAATSASFLAAAEAAPAASIEAALSASTLETQPLAGEDLIAQTTRGAYQGVAPAYLGVGGNLGIGDSSPLSDFGFAVVSKISLGPRFSFRPAAVIAERGISFPIPVTYNFNTTSLGGFTFQPYVGAGVDVPTDGGVGLLVDAGIDVPISRDFTVNATTNWRLTDGFGLGIIVGIGYNFPWIFE